MTWTMKKLEREAEMRGVTVIKSGVKDYRILSKDGREMARSASMTGIGMRLEAVYVS